MSKGRGRVLGEKEGLGGAVVARMEMILVKILFKINPRKARAVGITLNRTCVMTDMLLNSRSRP